jgi:hypothetical protein
MVSSHVIVLGTNHILQGGEKNPEFIIDPEYRSYICRIITDSKVDFIFEEATDSGPTVAERIAEERLEKAHYVDIDPIEKRKALGIGVGTQYEFLPRIPQVEFQELLFRLKVAEQQKREIAWTEAIQDTQFDCGLLICGLAHLLSMAFRLESFGCTVEARIYNPEHRACRRTHQMPIPGLILRVGDTETEL